MSLQPLTGTRALLTMTGLTCLATTVACGGGAAPELSGLSDQVAQVGTELKLDLNGTDPDGDQLQYDFAIAGLDDLDDRTSVSVSPSGSGVFRWTPTAADVGEHAVDFIVSDGSNDTTVTITIDVRSAIGSVTAPVFRQPLGTGTTIDLAKKKCINLDVVLEDQDTAQVDISQLEPIEGSDLRQNDGLTATWEWCPTEEQAVESRYTLSLAADDGDNPKTVKNYLVVLRGGTGSRCPGAAPSISHTPQDANTIVDLTVDASITDDKGLKNEPLFYYSLTNPGPNPNLSDMIQLSTLRIDGNGRAGTYAADVPNPVAGLPTGTTRTLYYVFVADDDDDEMGNCDHTTTSLVYSMNVTSSGAVNQPVCASCSSDAQCGAGDLCVYMGQEGASYCLQACAGGCPSGYGCSATPVYSVDGNQANQCIPSSGTCSAPGGMCQDDTHEEDDSRAAALANGPEGELAFATFVSCPKATPTTGAPSDDDWFQIRVTADTRADFWVYGNGESDIDLHLYKSDGTLLSQSTSLETDENIVKCLPTGTYFVKVNAWDRVRTEYALDYLPTAQSCNTSCVDDSREDDDTYSQARDAFDGYTSTGNAICPGDDDRYALNLAAGDTVTIDLTFTQSGTAQDIDLHMYQGDFTDLWPCSYENPSMCSSARGQSASANEHAVFTAPAAGEYSVVVRGWNNAANPNYAIAIQID